MTRLAIGALLPALSACTLAYSIRQTYANHDAAYFLLPSRFWELGVGSLLCLAHHNRRWLPRSARQSTLLASSGLIILLISDIFVNPVDFPFPLAIPPVLGTLLCIAGVVAPSGGRYRP